MQSRGGGGGGDGGDGCGGGGGGGGGGAAAVVAAWVAAALSTSGSEFLADEGKEPTGNRRHLRWLPECRKQQREHVWGGRREGKDGKDVRFGIVSVS